MMKESQLKNKAQIQQITTLKDSLIKLNSKISDIKKLLEVKDQGAVLLKIQQLDSSKKSLEGLRDTYQKEIDSLKTVIEQLREKIGKTIVYNDQLTNY